MWSRNRPRSRERGAPGAWRPAEWTDDPANDVPFAEFYATSFDWAARLAFLLTGNLATGEDIAQEALSRLHPRFDSIENPRAYLRKVVTNLSSRTRVQRDRERSTSERLESPRVEEARGRELADVIDGLPRRQRTVVVLRYFEDLSEAEIAKLLGCRPGTVKSLAARALANLRRGLNDD